MSPVNKIVPLDQLPDVQRMIADIERQLGDDGRVLVRYSGTESKARVMIEGHTDSTGSEALNDALSQRRADAVAQALMRRGISADNVQPIGRGKAFPVATNDTAAGRQQNRRVELVVSGEVIGTKIVSLSLQPVADATAPR